MEGEQGNHWQRIVKGKDTRRDFLKAARDVTAVSMLDRFPRGKVKSEAPPGKPPETRELVDPQLLPNGHVTLNFLSKIPEGLYKHSNKETISATINFSLCYKDDDTKFPGYLDFGNDKGYWQGVKEAIGRGQKVYITIELPGTYRPEIRIDDWRKFVANIASEFKGANFIIGNEINVEEWWRGREELFVEQFMAAGRAIKEVSPKSKCLMYGEAYFGRGEYLRKILDTLRQKTESQKIKLAELVDGLSFHFYDVVARLDDRVGLYQGIARDYGLPEKVYLTELGVAENAFFMGLKKQELERLQEEVVMQNTATALALVDEDKLEDIVWYTAYDINDTRGHSLSEIDDKGDVVRLKIGFDAFWRMARLLYQDVKKEVSEGITVIRGKNSNNEDTLVAWNNESPMSGFNLWDIFSGGQSRVRNLSLDEVSRVSLPRSSRQYSEGDVYWHTYKNLAAKISPGR